MKSKDIIIRVMAHLMVPLIMLFAIYIQVHGEISPGGGFQAGVVFASAIILYTLSFSDESFLKIISIDSLQIFAAIGALIYLFTGMISIFVGGNFLDYSLIFTGHEIFSREFGVFIVELGVGITVFSVMLILYFMFHALIKE